MVDNFFPFNYATEQAARMKYSYNCFILEQFEFSDIDNVLQRVGSNPINFYSEYHNKNKGVHSEFIKFTLDKLSIIPVDLDLERFFNIGSRIDKDRSRTLMGDELFEMVTILLQNWSNLPTETVRIIV